MWTLQPKLPVPLRISGTLRLFYIRLKGRNTQISNVVSASGDYVQQNPEIKRLSIFKLSNLKVKLNVLFFRRLMNC